VRQRAGGAADRAAVLDRVVVGLGEEPGCQVAGRGGGEVGHVVGVRRVERLQVAVRSGV
jgi:hypothetical protein